MAAPETIVEILRDVATWLPFLLVLAAAGLVAWGFQRTVMRRLQKGVEATKAGLDDLLVHSLHPAIVFIAFMVAAWAGVRLLGPWIPYPGLGWIQNLTFIAVALVAAMTAARLVQALLRHQVKHQPRIEPALGLANRVVHLLVYSIAFLVVLDHYDVPINPILTSFGIAGLAVALALQDTLGNFFAGVWIQSARNVSPGNYVRVEGIALDLQGYVVEVGWRTTKIRTIAGNYALVPNSKLTQSVIINYHLPRPETEVRITFATGYQLPPREVERILVAATHEASQVFPAILTKPVPKVQILDDLTPDQVKYTLRFFVRDLPDQYRAQHEIRTRVLLRLAEGGSQAGPPATQTGPDERAMDEAERTRPPTANQRAVAAEHVRRQQPPFGSGHG